MTVNVSEKVGWVSESGCYFSKIFNRAYTLLMNLWHAAWGALVYCLHSMPVLIHFPHYVKLLLNIFECNNLLKAIIPNILIHKTCKKGSCTLPHYPTLPYLLAYNHVVSKCSILLAHNVTNIFHTCPQVVCGIAAQPYKYIKSWAAIPNKTHEKLWHCF